MKRVAVIGGGVSGLSIAHCLKGRYEVKVFESASKPGGLIKCDRVEGNLYHIVGGHVFNSRRQDVLDWFWSFFNRETEFIQSTRNATIYLDKPIGYPIENHIYEMDAAIQSQIIADLINIAKSANNEPENFADFLKNRFGNTLYEIYFKPYNEKIWKRDLSKVPISWLEGKLPMPSVEEIIFNNFCREQEMNMVHSTFYYAKHNGSQFLADRLAEELDIKYNLHINQIRKDHSSNQWIINENEYFDLVVFTGNVKELMVTLSSELISDKLKQKIANLEFHGTTSVLCEIEPNPYSWVYIPDKNLLPHRIICTGNFSESNNRDNNTSCTIEFTDSVDEHAIHENLKLIPFKPRYIYHRYTKYTYPIQTSGTRDTIKELKIQLESENLFLIGRFAEWEYYNMDAAMGAAFDLNTRIRL